MKEFHAFGKKDKKSKMSEISKKENKQIRTFAIFLIFLGMLVIGLVLVSEDGKASGSGDYPPPSSGDWTINNATIVWNETIVLNGNLIINDGGNLTLSASSIK